MSPAQYLTFHGDAALLNDEIKSYSLRNFAHRQKKSTRIFLHPTRVCSLLSQHPQAHPGGPWGGELHAGRAE